MVIGRAIAMRSYKYKSGLTLIEMLIVVVVITLLALMVVAAVSRLDNSAREQLTKGTIGILAAALEQFDDYGYQYKHPSYVGFDFPLDCNGFAQPDLQTTLTEALLGIGQGGVLIDANDHNPNYSGCQALYFFLNRIPANRDILSEIDSSLVKSEGTIFVMTANSQRRYPLRRVVDSWGTTLQYDYYNEMLDPNLWFGSKRNFPVITSAGPDGNFGTADDIRNK